MSAPVVSVDGASFSLDDVLLRMYPHARALVRAAMGGDPQARQEARRVFAYALDRQNPDRARARLAAHLLRAALAEERKNAAALAAWQREQHATRSASYPVADYADIPQEGEGDGEEEMAPPTRGGRGGEVGGAGGRHRGPRPGARVINASMPNPDIPTPNFSAPPPVPGASPGTAAGWTRTPPPGHVDPTAPSPPPPSPPTSPGPTGGE